MNYVIIYVIKSPLNYYDIHGKWQLTRTEREPVNRSAVAMQVFRGRPDVLQHSMQDVIRILQQNRRIFFMRYISLLNTVNYMYYVVPRPNLEERSWA